MTRLEKLYESIQNLKELGMRLSEELIEETNRVEEEIIQNEVIPAMSDAIEPIITQIQRGLILIVEYIPDEPLQVKMTRKRSFKLQEDPEVIISKPKEFKKERGYTMAAHSKSPRTNLIVTFPNGSQISNQFASQTLCEVIERIGGEKVASLGLKLMGTDLVSKKTDEFYQQHQINGGYLVLTHSSTETKKNLIEEISRRLKLNLKVEKF